jgi:hypothetical protein
MLGIQTPAVPLTDSCGPIRIITFPILGHPCPRHQRSLPGTMTVSLTCQIPKGYEKTVAPLLNSIVSAISHSK